jgi:DNA repair protein RecO (recombination protein O)
MNEVKGLGFVLRKIIAQEADVILRILTSQGEKISAFAKAGLKSRKRFGGALEPLAQISFRAIKKESNDLYFLEEAQVKYEFKSLREDFEKLTAATAIAELAELGTREGLDNPEVYNLLGAAWKAIDLGLPSLAILRQFEVKLLSLLGWLPRFNVCAHCGKSGVDLGLQPEAGLVLCQDCGVSPIKISLQTQKTVNALLGTSLLKMEMTSEDEHQLQKITAPLFYEHFGHQKLRSAQFLGSLRRFQE